MLFQIYILPHKPIESMEIGIGPHRNPIAIAKLARDAGIVFGRHLDSIHQDQSAGIPFAPIQFRCADDRAGQQLPRHHWRADGRFQFFDTATSQRALANLFTKMIAKSSPSGIESTSLKTDSLPKRVESRCGSPVMCWLSCRR